MEKLTLKIERSKINNFFEITAQGIPNCLGNGYTFQQALIGLGADLYLEYQRLADAEKWKLSTSEAAIREYLLDIFEMEAKD